MVPKGRNYVTYYRVSTAKQGASGLGLESQRAAVQSYMSSHGHNELASFTEVETGSNDERPQLQKALKRCRQTNAILLVCKLDRLSRNAAFLLNLKEAGVKFQALDLPEVNTLTLGVLAVIAQHERETISARIRVALEARRARGKSLGTPRDMSAWAASGAAKGREVRTEQAKARAMDLKEVIADAREAGKRTLRQIAEHLNTLGIGTPRGSEWTAAGIQRLLKYVN